MQKPLKVQDKYYLKSVYQDIDLLDRKLAHLQKYDTFDSIADRQTAEKKINAARELLTRTAKRLVDEGIEFNESDLPRSFRESSAAPEVETAQPLVTQPLV